MATEDSPGLKDPSIGSYRERADSLSLGWRPVRNRIRFRRADILRSRFRSACLEATAARPHTWKVAKGPRTSCGRAQLAAAFSVASAAVEAAVAGSLGLLPRLLR